MFKKSLLSILFSFFIFSSPVFAETASLFVFAGSTERSTVLTTERSVEPSADPSEDETSGSGIYAKYRKLKDILQKIFSVDDKNSRFLTDHRQPFNDLSNFVHQTLISQNKTGSTKSPIVLAFSYHGDHSGLSFDASEGSEFSSYHLLNLEIDKIRKLFPNAPIYIVVEACYSAGVLEISRLRLQDPMVKVLHSNIGLTILGTLSYKLQWAHQLLDSWSLPPLSWTERIHKTLSLSSLFGTFSRLDQVAPFRSHQSHETPFRFPDLTLQELLQSFHSPLLENYDPSTMDPFRMDQPSPKYLRYWLGRALLRKLNKDSVVKKIFSSPVKERFDFSKWNWNEKLLNSSDPLFVWNQLERPLLDSITSSPTDWSADLAILAYFSLEPKTQNRVASFLNVNKDLLESKIKTHILERWILIYKIYFLAKAGHWRELLESLHNVFEEQKKGEPKSNKQFLSEVFQKFAAGFNDGPLAIDASFLELNRKWEPDFRNWLFHEFTQLDEQAKNLNDPKSHTRIEGLVLLRIQDRHRWANHFYTLWTRDIKGTTPEEPNLKTKSPYNDPWSCNRFLSIN